MTSKYRGTFAETCSAMRPSRWCGLPLWSSSLDLANGTAFCSGFGPITQQAEMVERVKLCAIPRAPQALIVNGWWWLGMAKEIWEPRNSENMVRVQYESTCVWTYPVSSSHHITSCHMSKIILASCFANVRSWLARVQCTQITYSKHASENVNILIPWVERLKIGFAKKKQPFALCIRYTYMKWDGEFLLGTASMLLEARPFCRGHHPP